MPRRGWTAEALLQIANFSVSGDARSDTLSRVIGLVAQLGLTPLHVDMRRVGDVALLGIVQDDLDPVRATILAEKMRALVSISAVELTFQTRERL